MKDKMLMVYTWQDVGWDGSPLHNTLGCLVTKVTELTL